MKSWASLVLLTADIEEKTPDNAEAKILQTLSSLLESALQECDKKRTYAAHADLKKIMIAEAGKQKDKFQETKFLFGEALKCSKALLGRFTTEDGQNRMEMILRGRCQTIEDQMKVLTDNIEHILVAIKVLEGYDFTQERQESYGSPLFAMLAAGGN